MQTSVLYNIESRKSEIKYCKNKELNVVGSTAKAVINIR